MIKRLMLTVFWGVAILTAPAYSEDCVYRIPDTGQTTCYDDEKEIPCPKPGQDFYGQDAHYTINPMSFTKLDPLPDNAADWVMVKDNNTGLIWEVKTNDGSIHDKENQYFWRVFWRADKDTFIAKLNQEKYGGYSDWRIPAREELRSIVNYGTLNLAIDKNYFPNTRSAHYWSSTTYANGTSGAWYMYFYYGNDYNNYESYGYYVRAVRGGQCGSFDDSDHLVIQPAPAPTTTLKPAPKPAPKPEIAQTEAPQPKVWFSSPSSNIETELSYVQVEIQAENLPEKPEALALYVNDKLFPLASTKGKAVRPSVAGETIETIVSQVPLIIGYNKIEVKVRDKDGRTHTFPARTIIRKGKILPVLYFFGVGVSQHQNKAHSLRYPAKDAAALAAALKTQKGKAWSDVKTQILTDSDATREKIIMGLDRFISQARSEDLFILFLSGHGVNKQTDYYFITHNSDPENVIVNGLSWLTLMNLLRKASVMTLLLADTCYSGSVVGTDLIPKADNILVLSSSSGNRISREDVSWGHGAFSLALIEAFTGKEAFNTDGEMTLLTLQDYVGKRVRKLTEDNQTPEIPDWSNFQRFNTILLGRKAMLR